MKNIDLLILGIIILFYNKDVYAATCPDGWLSFGESCYLFGKTAMGFVTAEQYCRQHGGHLVHVNDGRENNFLKDQMRERKDHLWWIGITDEEIENEWKWYDTNTVAHFTDFHAGDTGDHGNEDCAFFTYGYNYQWADAPCSHTPVLPLCERPSDPEIVVG